MATLQTTDIRTLADLVDRLGGVPLDRIRFQPPPGTATVADVIRIEAREGRLCELVDGILVEKTMGYPEALLAGYLLIVLDGFVRPRILGLVAGPDGMLQLIPDLVRIPDVGYVSWDRLPGRETPKDQAPLLAPDLAVEVLSPGNTVGEMAAKRQDYFAAGVRLVWEVDPARREVDVYTDPAQRTTLRSGDTLDGGDVLPGFSLSVADLFAELDRRG